MNTLPWMQSLEESGTFYGKPISYWLNLEQELQRKTHVVELPDRSFRTLRIVCDRYVPPRMADELAKVELRNYIGPVTSIRVTGYEMQLQFTMNVVDVATKQPVSLQVYGGHLSTRATYHGMADVEFALRLIRGGLRFCLLHELDESLFYDGKFVTDPHPGL